jgi:hypothetical protein
VLTLAFKVLFDILSTYNIASAAASSSLHSNNKKENDDNPNNNNKRSSDSIQICCTWNREGTNGVLTYSITGGTPELRDAVLNAVNEWNSNIKNLNLKLVEATSREGTSKADIQINFKSKASKINTDFIGSKLEGNDIHLAAAGRSTFAFDSNGFISRVKINLAKSAFGSSLDTQKIEQVALHEIGHALGLGHANFKEDLMSPIVNFEKPSISQCDIKAVKQANRLVDIILDLNSKSHSFHSVKVKC